MDVCGGMKGGAFEPELNIVDGRELARDPRLKPVWEDILMADPDETVAVLPMTWCLDVGGEMCHIPDVAGGLCVVADVGKEPREMLVSKRTFKNDEVSSVFGSTM